MYSNLDYTNQEFHQDHLHPSTIFTNEEKFAQLIPDEIQDFARQRENWNGVANLQLLNGRQNESKNARPLIEWANEENKTHGDLFLSEGTSLEIKDFKEFIIDRKKNIKKYIKTLLMKYSK